MRPLIDVTGDTFGRLTAVIRIGGRRGLWVFKCSCGKSVKVALTTVKSGNTLSCGCAKKKLAPGDYTYNQYFCSTRHSAKIRGLEFSLSKEDHLALLKGFCYYCGSEPRKYQHTRENVPVYINGIDRVDNSIGYITSNCVSCCEQCNISKREYSVDEFISHARKLIKFQDSGRR